jgi:SAM-dependent methyltransferase
MPAFAAFDRRHYPTVPARDGYALWSDSYESTIKPDMDRRLLDALTSVDWPNITRAADLGCGTGRTGEWLRARGVRDIDGVDLTPEMLARARERGVFTDLRVADVRATGLPPAAYDLVTTCLVDEHLPDLAPLYRESARLTRPGGAHVLVSFHPFFAMRLGMPTHFPGPDGPLAIETHLHLFSDHVTAALAAGWRLAEAREQLIDDRWIAQKPSWSDHRDVPISHALVWRR